MRKIREKKKFKVEYIPVIVSFLILIILVGVLIFIIRYNKDIFDVDVPDQDYITNEMIVDTSDSLCKKKEVEDLYKKANEITISYEEEKVVIGESQNQETLEIVDAYGYVFNVEFKNVPEDIYLVIKSDNINFEDDKVTLKGEDAKDGVLKYQTKYTELIVEYTVSVYAAKYDCQDELFRKFTFKTPIYNRYHDMYICDAYPEFELCKEFITEDKPSMQVFYNRLYKYGKENDIVITNTYESIYGTTTKKGETTTKVNEDKNDEKEKKDENITKYIIVITLAVLLISGVSVLVIKKRK